MNEPLIIVWTFSALVFGFLFFRIAGRQKRLLSPYLALYKLGFLLLFFISGLLTFQGLKDSPHLVWVSRLTLLILGSLHLLILYFQSWVKRDKFQYSKDSIFIEWIFTVLMGVLGALAFSFTPKLLKIMGPETRVSLDLWDAPFVFMLPFLVFKLADLASQIPYRIVEKTWVFPIEPVNTETWAWRNLMQVNFQVTKSLLDEYRIFTWAAHPWIEVPKEAMLGDVFRLVIQERRRRPDFATIQDMGDEYGGNPKFWWLFSIKRVWWNPNSWFRQPRYLNPDASINGNKLRKSDIIMARRIPSEGIEIQFRQKPDYDPDKTIFISR